MVNLIQRKGIVTEKIKKEWDFPPSLLGVDFINDKIVFHLIEVPMKDYKKGVFLNSIKKYVRDEVIVEQFSYEPSVFLIAHSESSITNIFEYPTFRFNKTPSELGPFGQSVKGRFVIGIRWYGKGEMANPDAENAFFPFTKWSELKRTIQHLISNEVRLRVEKCIMTKEEMIRSGRFSDEEINEMKEYPDYPVITWVQHWK